MRTRVNNAHNHMSHAQILASGGVLCYNSSCRDLQMGAFFMPNNPILRGRVATITLGKRPVSLDNLRSSGGYFAYEEMMSKSDGLPCRKCGTSDWYDNNTNCRQCQRERNKRWNRENPEVIREASRKWRTENRERHNARSRRWYDNNKDRAKESMSRWEENNPENRSVRRNRRRTRKTQAGGNYTATEFKALCKQYDNRCACCGKKAKLTADHVIPVVAGGTSDISNIQPLCKSCNSSKGTKTTDYRTKPGIKRWVQEKLL